MSKLRISFIVVAALTILSMVLTACAPQTVEVIKTVEVQVEVEKEVVKTVEVVKETIVEVTPTPVPPTPTPEPIEIGTEANPIIMALAPSATTQELIASMLGVRREGITEAAGNLQRAGVISYRRGHIAVLDRAGLEQRVCECYDVVKTELKRLLCDVRYRQNDSM